MKMKKFFFFLLLFFYSLNVYAKDFYPLGIKEIKSRGKIVIAMYNKDIFPFFFQNKKGELIGYDVKISKTIAKELDVGVEFNRSPKTFDEIIEYVSSGKADIGISLISVTLNRAKKVFFSDPYLILHPVLVLNRLKSTNYSFIFGDKIPGVIGIKKGTSYGEFAKKIFLNPKLKFYNSWNDVVKDLTSGKIFAMLRDEVGVANMLSNDPSLSIRIKRVVIKDFYDYIAIAINPKYKHLYYWINLFLKTNKFERNVNKIIKKYKSLIKK